MIEFVTIKNEKNHDVIITRDGRKFRRKGGTSVSKEGKNLYTGGLPCYNNGKIWSIFK